MEVETRYKKALVNILYYQVINKSKEEIQPTLFIDEETTNNWTVQQCRIQYCKDQLDFIRGCNLDDESNETWKIVFRKESL